MDIHQELKELSKFLSEYSTSLMAVGVQTSRIVRNTSRIAESFGFFCDMTIFQKTIIMTLRDADNSAFIQYGKQDQAHGTELRH